MNKYEELARKALAGQQQRKDIADAEDRERKARFDADEAEKRSYLDAEVQPILRDAANGLVSAGIPAAFGKAEASFEPAIVLKIGHNAGRTAHRQSTLTARRVGNNLEVEVSTMHGSQGRWQTPKDSPASAIDPALEKGVDIWTERNPLQPR